MLYEFYHGSITEGINVFEGIYFRFQGNINTVTKYFFSSREVENSDVAGLKPSTTTLT